MLEAVNTVLQSAPLVRGNAEQTSNVDSIAANPERTQKAPVLAPFISPYIHMDVNYGKAVIQLRNGDTGDVEGQFPSEAALEQVARAAAQQQATREASFRAETSGTPQRAAVQAQLEQASTPAPAPRAPTPQQQAAFTAAAQSGNTNAGNVTLFA